MESKESGSGGGGESSGTSTAPWLVSQLRGAAKSGGGGGGGDSESASSSSSSVSEKAGGGFSINVKTMTKSFVVPILRHTSLAAFVDLLGSSTELASEIRTDPPKRVRVIHLGKLLRPSDVVDEVVPDGGVVHVVISDAVPHGGSASAAANNAEPEPHRMFHASEQVERDERLARRLALDENAWFRAPPFGGRSASAPLRTSRAVLERIHRRAAAGEAPFEEEEADGVRRGNEDDVDNGHEEDEEGEVDDDDENEDGEDEDEEEASDGAFVGEERRGEREVMRHLARSGSTRDSEESALGSTPAANDLDLESGNGADAGRGTRNNNNNARRARSGRALDNSVVLIPYGGGAAAMPRSSRRRTPALPNAARRGGDGDVWDFLWGFGLAFLVGPLVLFLAFDSAPKLQRFGIIVGISVRAMVSSVRIAEDIDLDEGWSVEEQLADDTMTGALSAVDGETTGTVELPASR